MTTTTTKTTSHQQTVQGIVNEIASRLPERREIIEGTMAAVLAGEHVLYIGLPGTAKSAMARALKTTFGLTYFEWLMTKFTTPEEVFGPVSLKAIEQDHFSRILNGRAADVQVLFLDECFKANSAILNSFLTLVNERVYHNDGTPVRAPLVTMFGASNELPEGKELEALFDRFLVRYEFHYLVRASNFRSMVTAPDPLAHLGTYLTAADLAAAQAEVAAIKVTDDTVDGLIEIRDALKAEGVIASDRRWKKTLRLVQAVAWMTGQAETSREDLSVLVDCLWREPKERAKIARVVGQIADPVSAQAVQILDAARETAARAGALRSTDRKQYIGKAAEALDLFDAQQKELTALAANAGKRATQTITDAVAEVKGLRMEIARTLSAGLNLRSARS